MLTELPLRGTLHRKPRLLFMKIDRHGQAKILTPEEIQLIFSPSGLRSLRDRAIFGVCLYAACRINEAVTLRITDVYNRKGSVRSELMIRKGNTKGKLATRTIPIISPSCGDPHHTRRVDGGRKQEVHFGGSMPPECTNQ